MDEMNQEEASDNKQQHPTVQTLSNSAATELPGHLEQGPTLLLIDVTLEYTKRHLHSVNNLRLFYIIVARRSAYFLLL